ncbi:MAG: DMT family transporter [Gammaproteobacteria bacterium]|nr:DMT family transporter [Gammaproteobacteria bacterium]MDG2338407.1 DMT family transporter [Gammaproteobacteria bacterium]
MQASKPALEDYLVLILLSAIWGASFLFLRVSSPVFGPFFLIEMRVASGLLVLLPLCIAMKKHHEIIANWRSLFVLSLCNMTLPFCLLAYATLSIGAGFASILNATVPFFTAILAFTFWQQKLSLTAVMGMLLGFVGVVLLMLSYSGPIAANVPLKAIAAGLLGAVLYGLAINLTAAHLYKLSGVAITTGSLLFSSIILLPFAYWQMPDVLPTGSIWFSVFSLGIVCTGFAFVLFYRLISRIGSNLAVTNTFLIPLFSLFWGNLFLAEEVTTFMLFACMLVLAGVGMTTGTLARLLIFCRAKLVR